MRETSSYTEAVCMNKGDASLSFILFPKNNSKKHSNVYFVY